MAKVSPTDLSRLYSILRGVISPEFLIEKAKKKNKKKLNKNSIAKTIGKKMAQDRGVIGGRTKSNQDKKKSGGKVSKKVSRKK